MLTQTNFSIYQLLEQIHHLCDESKNKTSIIQAPIENQNNFQNITKGTQKKQENFLQEKQYNRQTSSRSGDKHF